MGVSHQQTIDKVFFFNTCSRLALTAAALRFIVAQWLILHIALVRQRNYHVFLVDQVFDIDI
ncbi:hypothetical protein D3C72_872480 [compost metagenome]